MTTQQQPLREGKRGAPRLLVSAGMAAAVIELVCFLLLFLLAIFAHQQFDIGDWFRATTGLNDDAAFALIVGGSLAGCLVGFVLGVIGWVVARRRGASTLASRLTVFVSLIAPVAAVVVYFVLFCIGLSSLTAPS